MTRIPAERIAAIEARKEELQQAMSAPDLAPETFVQLSKDYAEILPVADAARELRRLRAELEVLDEMLADPAPDIREMAQEEKASLDAQRMATGSYAGAAVQAPIVLVRADASSYCLQLEQGAELQHLAGPSGTPQPDAC